MTDNSSLPVASGNETFANDDIGGVKYPRPKINWGPDGTANDVDVASGKPLPAQIRSATGLIPIGEPTDAKSTATDTTSASAISIWKQISASVQALNTAIGSTLWDLGVGTGGSRTQRVAIDTASQNANGQATMANSTPTVLPSDFVGTSGFMKKEDVASADGDAGVGILAVRKATPADTSGTDGDYEFLSVKDGMLWTRAGAVTSGGLSRSRTLIPNNTTAIVVKSGAGQLYKIRATNNSATIAYIKLYDATSATAGSGTPVDTIMIPASTSGAGVVDSTDIGTVHATGITYIVTTGIADADTAAPAANAYVVTFYYK